MSKKFSPKEYLEAVSDFLKEMETHALVKTRITNQEQIIDLFRFWYMDCREQEALEEMKDMNEKDRWGLGDMLDDDE